MEGSSSELIAPDKIGKLQGFGDVFFGRTDNWPEPGQIRIHAWMRGIKLDFHEDYLSLNKQKNAIGTADFTDFPDFIIQKSKILIPKSYASGPLL